MTIEYLKRRAEIVRKIRRHFDEYGFTEVETPVRIAAPAPEPHIDCPLAPTSHLQPPTSNLQPPTSNLQPPTSYLRASPELQMKKLLAYGMDKIYQIGPCFREGEKGSRHNPEFTMLEWYRRNVDYQVIADDMRYLFITLGIAERMSDFTIVYVRDMFHCYAGWDPWTQWNRDRFDFDMAEKIEPHLPLGLVFLTNYPPEACSLARVRENIAERWELYWRRIELANCFTELCDADEQRRRFGEARQQRRALGESDYPIDEEFLNLLPLIKSAAGVALGIDRLVMVALGARNIMDVRCAE